MRLPHLLSTLALLLPLSAATDPSTAPLSTVSVLLWPPSVPSPAPYLDISYSTTAQITKRHALPSLPADDEFVRLGFYRADLVDATNPAKAWAGIAIPPAAVGEARNVTVELLVTRAGTLYHVGLKSTGEPKPPAGKSGKKKGLDTKTEGTVAVALRQDQVGSKPVLNKPVVLTKEGKVEGDEVDTRSFLQKYWWAIAIFLVMQVVMSGGGEGK